MKKMEIILYLLEIIGLILILDRTLPFLIQVRDTGSALGTPYMRELSIFGGILIWSAFITRRRYFKLTINRKSNKLSLIIEFLSRIVFTITGAFIGIIYLQSWVLHWKWDFALVYIPVILFSIFLVFKDFINLSEELKGD